MNLPPVVSREQWLVARKALLAKEKAATRAKDALNTERRKLPMVRVEKDYVFDGRRFRLHVVSGDGDDVFVMYEYELLTGERHRNVEVFTVRDSKVVEAQVFFGGNYFHCLAYGRRGCCRLA